MDIGSSKNWGVKLRRLLWVLLLLLILLLLGLLVLVRLGRWRRLWLDRERLLTLGLSLCRELVRWLSLLRLRNAVLTWKILSLCQVIQGVGPSVRFWLWLIRFWLVQLVGLHGHGQRLWNDLLRE